MRSLSLYLSLYLYLSIYLSIYLSWLSYPPACMQWLRYMDQVFSFPLTYHLPLRHFLLTFFQRMNNLEKQIHTRAKRDDESYNHGNKRSDPYKQSVRFFCLLFYRKPTISVLSQSCTSDLIGETGMADNLDVSLSSSFIRKKRWSSNWAKRRNYLPFLSHQSCHCLINSPPDQSSDLTSDVHQICGWFHLVTFSWPQTAGRKPQVDIQFVSDPGLIFKNIRPGRGRGLIRLKVRYYYRKRGSASYIVRGVLSVRERDTERERERERERRKWRHHCRAKIGDEFTLSLAKNS